MASNQNLKYLDINTASTDELQTLPGIGPSRAEAIVKARTVSTSNCCLKMKICLSSGLVVISAFQC